MLAIINLNVTELLGNRITLMALWLSLYIYSPNDRVWENPKEIFGLNHKLLESLKLSLEAIILFAWEITYKEKKLWFPNFPHSKKKNCKRKERFL